MELIVDNNVAALVFLPSEEPAFVPVHEALHTGRVVAVHGGRLTREYVRNHDILRRLALLDRQGAARVLPDDEVDKQEATVAASGLCKSDDPHVLAVALVGKVRLLVSNDAALINDFRHKAIIDKPRGRVYSTVAKRRGARSRPEIFTELLRRA